jgi:uncharacterized protein YceK
MTALEQIKYVKEKANITEVIGHFVELKRDGASFKGMSPFSDERSPSFVVNPVKNIFKCFSSGKSGDVIDFVSITKGISSKEAIKWIIDFYAMPNAGNEWRYIPALDLPVSYIDFDTYLLTRGSSRPNYFFDWLRKTIGQPSADQLIQTYNLGTSKHWQGANIFWQFDTGRLIRGGKIMLYNPTTGKRVKEPTPHITWVHRAARIENYNLSQCLFGEHLLSTRPDAIVKIVESEKTALIAAHTYPDFIWLASGSLTNLSTHRCAPLAGRKISLIPDCGAEQQWIDKCTQLRQLIKADWVVDCIPGDNPKGYDLCDYILDNKLYLYENRNLQV